MTSRPLADHLAAAIAAPLNREVFLDGYREVLAEVARPGCFELHGLRIEAPAGVYSPHETSSTRFMMDRFPALGLDRPGGRLLEVGCGAGAIALLAARHGWAVCAGDVDPVAVEAAVRNAAANGLSLDARVSDLFDGFAGERFDAIVFNQPFFHLDREPEPHERSLSAFGAGLHARFLREARHHLAPGGFVVLAYSNCSSVDELAQPGWTMQLRAFDFDASANYIRAHFRAVPGVGSPA